MLDCGRLDLELVAARFRAVTKEWALEEADIVQLLGIPATSVRDAMSGGESLDVKAETRMRHAIDVAGTVSRLLSREEPCNVWIRSPNRALFGRSPLAVMISEPRGLAAIRHRLLSELADRAC